MSDESVESGGTEFARKTPGAQLRAAREARSLRLDAVAESLGLARELIAALESDDYDRLGAPVYVRGYLRKYARFLGLDGDALVRAYEQEASPHDPEVLAHAAPGISRRSGKRWLALAVATIVIVVLVLAGIWAWRYVRHAHEVAHVPAATAVSIHTVPAKTTRMTSAVVPPTLPGVAASVPVAAQTGTRLVLAVQKPCWIEVSDANGKHLYYNLAPSGKTLSFTVEHGALKVFLGNADGVEVTVNGKVFPIPAGNRSGNTAHFEVEATGASAAATAA
ncbi:MAG: helix-turn-helix domain-containing protein [Gammaproteobacteria bacterium]